MSNEARYALVKSGGLTLDSPAAREAVERITGYRVAVRTLASWAERGVVVPSFWPHRRGRWHPRRYTVRDMKRLVLVARLRQAGYSMQRVRVVLERLAPDFFDGRSHRTLVIVGDALLVRGTNDPDVELMSGQSMFRFDTVELRDTRQTIARVAAEHERRRRARR